MKRHCCDTMEKQLEGVRQGTQFDDSDWLINFVPKYDEYGIIIHDGGESYSSIQFCPWCGNKLPESKRDEWFDKLEALGFDDPSEQDIPDDFKTDKWYQNP